MSQPNNQYITLQLLGIINIDNSWAYISVKVVSEGSYLSFVKKVSDEQKATLEQSAKYSYTPSWDNSWDWYKQTIRGIRVGERLFICRWDDFLGGPDKYEDYIYTDDDGIDHLVQSNYRSWHEKETLFGDKVLGFHKYCPIETEVEIVWNSNI